MSMEEGGAFTSLPLNIKSFTNFHINAGFALTSNRRSLWIDDCVSKDDIRTKWNESLLVEEIPMAVINALKELKSQKAAGPDMIIGELLKFATDEIKPFFVTFFNYIFDRGIYPENWTESIILPLYKKGDINDPSNYRGISLSDISSKVYGKIINKRIQQWVDTYRHTHTIIA